MTKNPETGNLVMLEGGRPDKPRVSPELFKTLFELEGHLVDAESAKRLIIDNPGDEYAVSYIAGQLHQHLADLREGFEKAFKLAGARS